MSIESSITDLRMTCGVRSEGFDEDTEFVARRHEPPFLAREDEDLSGRGRSTEGRRPVRFMRLLGSAPCLAPWPQPMLRKKVAEGHGSLAWENDPCLTVAACELRHEFPTAAARRDYR